MKDCTVLVGDWIEQLQTLPACSVQSVITSPPYFGLRDYGTGQWQGGDAECDHLAPATDCHPSQGPNKGNNNKTGMPYRKKCKKCGAVRLDRQFGLEETPDAYVAKFVEGCREIWRVLRDDGTFWLNLGASYCNAGSRNNGTGLDGKRRGGVKDTNGTWSAAKNKYGDIRHRLRGSGFKHKDLIGIPWLVALALQQDGWYLRQDIIWDKPNAMTTSAQDRCTTAHEYLFLLTKKPRYYYDWFAISTPTTSTGGGITNKASSKPLGTGLESMQDHEPDDRANKRSVWHVPVANFKGAHFATFPVKLITPCVLAGTSEKGCCPKCGAPWRRLLKKKRVATRSGAANKVNAVAKNQRTKTVGNRDPLRHVTVTKTIGWEPTCDCGMKETVPCVILDPFMGSGTTAFAAIKKNRRAIGIELNPEYVNLIKQRVRKAKMTKGFGL